MLPLSQGRGRTERSQFPALPLPSGPEFAGRRVGSSIADSFGWIAAEQRVFQKFLKGDHNRLDPSCVPVERRVIETLDRARP